MTSRASCMRSRAWTSSAARAPWRATASTSATDRSAPVRTTRSRCARDGRALGEEVGVGHDAEDSRLSSPSCPRAAAHAARLPRTTRRGAARPVIGFIDEIALPFLQSLYAAVGYVGVMLAMAIESAMIPLPSELILPVGRVHGLGSVADRAADRAALELLDRRDRGDHRQHAGVADRLRDRRLGRPPVPGALRQVHADPRARARGSGPLLRPVRLGDRVHRPPAADRPDVHLVPGRRRPHEHRQVHPLLDARCAARGPCCSSGRASSWAPTG